MTAQTGEGRREVAAGLRKTRGIMAFVEELGIDPDSDWCWTDVSRRVADLIDPTCTYEHRNVADTFGRFMVTLGCGHRFVWYDGNEKLRYCPECGARVVDE